jgi:hypothetical protein
MTRTLSCALLPVAHKCDPCRAEFVTELRLFANG